MRARWSFADKDMKVIGRYAQAHDLIPELSVAVVHTVYFRRRDTGDTLTRQLKDLHYWWEQEKSSKKEASK